MITDTYVRVNVSGRIFEIKSDLLVKIPYIRNMVEGCGVDRKGKISEELRLDRSALVFDHVLSYAQDPFYPYPAKYSYELDFLDVVYDKENLYDSNPKIKELEKQIKLLHKMVDQIGHGVFDCASVARYEGYNCPKFGCTNSIVTNRVSCKKCYPLCANKYCQVIVNDTNYCDIHITNNSLCHRKGCWRWRLADETLCFNHLLTKK